MKELYFTIDNGNFFLTAKISGCIEWMKADIESIEKEGDEVPVYTLGPLWLTEDEFNNLPESDY